MRVFFKTFGCRTNQFDTQIMINNLRDFTLSDEDSSDIIVINSCTVTNGADSSVRGYISKMEHLGKKVYLTGCGAFSKGEDLFNSGKVEGVFGHSNKKDINRLLKSERFFELGDLEYINQDIVTEFVGKSRAFIKIQEGCNFECSYCIIPSVRGKARSIDRDTIIKQIEILSNNGFGEFILTGTNVGSYGVDFGSNISKLIKDIVKIRGVRRVRIGSLEPSQIDSEFIELLDNEKLERHLHIAIQHTDDFILSKMNRKNRFDSDLELYNKIAKIGYSIGTDFIVGFPYETKSIWQNGFDNLKKLPITHIHPFTYSRRDGTKASKMKLTSSQKEARGRIVELKEVVKNKNFEFRLKHQELNILIETKDDNYYIGYDQFFNRCYVESDLDLVSTWINIKDYEVGLDGNYAKI